MNFRTLVYLAVSILFLGLSSSADAQIPRLISHQGILTDDSGIPLPDDSYSVDFIMYDDSTSGSQLWYETHVVETDAGLFNVQLGRHVMLEESIFIDHTDLFLAMQPSGQPEMSPRTRLTSSAFSYRAFHANQADIALVAVIGGGWRDDGTIVRLDVATDNVGIGTSTPSAKLDVDGDMVVTGKTTFGASQTNTGDAATITGGADNVAEGIVSTIGGGQANLVSDTGSTVGGGVANQTFASFSTISGGGPSDFGDIINTCNRAYDRFGTIGGGSANRVGINDGNSETGVHATVGGGHDNWASGAGSVVGGGRGNQAHGDNATVAGGGGPDPSDANVASGNWSVAVGGVANVASGQLSFVGGGGANRAQEDASTVGGGSGNMADSAYSTVGGGVLNSASGNSATVSGGYHNQATGISAVVSGGSWNLATGLESSVGGGSANRAHGNYAVVCGGGGYLADSNAAIGEASAIGGGIKNIAEGQYAVIGGGGGNSTDGEAAVVGGGIRNDATASYTTIGGGYYNAATMTHASVGGGHNNEASGGGATVPGGGNNVAGGNNSFAAGNRAKALHDGTFVWADFTAADFQSTGANKFLIRASGGVGIGTVSPGAMLDVSGPLNALRLRSGNGQLEFSKGQIVMSYNQSSTYSHSIRTRHSSGNASLNAIEFYVWDPAVDASIELGTKHVMTIDGEGTSGQVGIGTTDPNYTLDVRGAIGNNTTTYHSDVRWKTNIQTIPEALEKVSALRGVNFEWKHDEYSEMNFPGGKHLGVIAQEVEAVLPEVVHTADDGYKSVEYANLIALLIESVKELKTENEELKRRMAKLESQMDE